MCSIFLASQIIHVHALILVHCFCEMISIELFPSSIKMLPSCVVYKTFNYSIFPWLFLCFWLILLPQTLRVQMEEETSNNDTMRDAAWDAACLMWPLGWSHTIIESISRPIVIQSYCLTNAKYVCTTLLQSEPHSICSFQMCIVW